MAKADLLVTEIQDLLDAGYSMTKTASVLGLDHKQVGRVIEKYKLEFYSPFDEQIDTNHLYQNFEWLWEEDKLEEIGDKAFHGVVKLSVIRNEDDIVISKYCIQKYGGLIGYFKKKKQTPLVKNVYKKCCSCQRWRRIKNYHHDSVAYFGLSSRCKKCAKENLKNWRWENPEQVNVNQLNRRARLKNLPNDLTEKQLDTLMGLFDGSCVLTGSDESLHIDHVIPIAVGHGGTTFGNVVPLRSDLNTSKNDSNIFEWFEANRQRFELSQERFDSLIAWLASANAMTVEEYRDYVYWCHANPRDIDELEAKSIEQKRSS